MLKSTYIPCPTRGCVGEVECELYYEPADRSVGIMSGGYELDSVKGCDAGHFWSKRMDKLATRDIEAKLGDFRFQRDLVNDNYDC